MSQSLAIVCEDCDRFLCVGQSSLTFGWYVYGAPEDMGKLSAFVHKHINHSVRFMDLDAVSISAEDEDPE